MSHILIVYYSRRGENYCNGAIRDLPIGNTEVVAGMVAEHTGGDLFRIETVEPYAEGYRDCVARAVAEAREGARPALKAYPSLDGYDTVFLGYPNWCGTMPMAVFTFLERHDWSGKRICPFCTNEGSGLGKSEADLRAACPGARVERGLSVHGAEAAQAEPQVAAWVKGLL